MLVFVVGFVAKLCRPGDDINPIIEKVTSVTIRSTNLLLNFNIIFFEPKKSVVLNSLMLFYLKAFNYPKSNRNKH